MNIVRLTTRIFPDKAGPAVYAYQLSKNVANKNFNLFNVTCQPDGVKGTFREVNSNFKIFYLPLHTPRWDEHIIKQVRFFIKFLYYSFKTLLRIHRKHRIDLIHSDNPAITGLMSVVFNRMFNIPFIYTQHGLDSHFKLNFLLEVKLISKFVSVYNIVSRRMIPFFKKNKVDAKKLMWIPVGVELNRFYHVNDPAERKRVIRELKLTSIVDSDDFIIIYVGYMDLKQKVLGMIDFLQAFKSFCETLSPTEKEKVKLLYIGDGKYRDLLNKKILQLSLQNNVHSLGIQFQIEKFYSISNFLALTSYMEGFPIVLLEAIASQIPCICTDVGEVNEILDGNSIVPCGNVELIIAKLIQLYHNKEICKRIVEVSKEKIKKFDWKNLAKTFKKIYLSVIIKNRIKSS
ncbi:MAG: glycosyltransferase [Candidatus Lokiarchaeota archaeon]|nr:glycosyltransferase [Candidatus Lokiarchaeota archaeon]